MTVKNYVLDINKTSLQHPSIVLRQDDYNIYTVNISVTENGVPVNLGSYTLNFLGITPAGAKIIDSENFITNASDLAVGKFSYRFPKEAAGSKGVYDVAYFRLKTSSGATSTIDLNLRVLGGIDLTADEVKDYITVDDTLRNTLVSEVFKKVDAKVDEHLATVKKGDKGDKGDPGKDAEIPDIGGRNYLLNSAFLNGFYGWNNENNSWTIDSSTYQGNPVIKSPTTTGGGSRIVQRMINPPASGSKVTVSFNARGNDSNSILLVVLFNANQINIPLTSSFSRYTVSFTIPSDFSVPQIYFWNLVDGNNVFLNSIKLEVGNVATDWTPAIEDVPSNDAQLVHKTGNETIAGDKTFTGTLVANNPIIGTLSIAMLPQKDLNSATVTGKYKIDSSYSNIPRQMPNGAFIDVLNFDGNLIYQVIVTRDISYPNSKSTMWVRIKMLGSWGNWQSISKDDNVLHNSGNETVAGDKTFTGNTTLATTTILAGNYGLRVTSSGFQKTTDGKTWVSANI